jgi:hypothetical protein
MKEEVTEAPNDGGRQKDRRPCRPAITGDALHSAPRDERRIFENMIVADRATLATGMIRLASVREGFAVEPLGSGLSGEDEADPDDLDVERWTEVNA